MGKEQRAKRDGSGPFKDSLQKQTSTKGKRQQRGEACPASPVKKNSRLKKN